MFDNEKFGQFKKIYMDPISDTYCGAKWFETTIWLHQGVTSSCHHNPYHKIELDPNDPSSLHNTPQKRDERLSMLNSEKPSGCDYCWNTEKSGSISDRVIKTQAIPRKIFFDWKNSPVKELNVDPYMVEVAFDRICNLACAYCGPSFSTKWVSDIKKNGPYIGIKTDSRYNNDPFENIIRDESNNPYIDAFFKWLPKLEKSLKWIRITGGEPTMSPNFWIFLDRLSEGTFNRNLSINTNLIVKEETLDKLLSKAGKFHTSIHTSIESSLEHAEYIRDGFNKEVWLKNVYKILESPSYVINRLNFTTSINNIGIWSMIDYFNMIGNLKKKYGKGRVELSCNFVHYPAFMRIQMIPYDMKVVLMTEYQKWLNDHKDLCHDSEINHVERLLQVLSEKELRYPSYIKEEDVYKDLKIFIEQYDNRRHKNFRKVLDPRFISWYDSI